MRERLRRAWPAMLFVHACLCLCALSTALPIASSVTAPAEAEPYHVELLLVVLRLWIRATDDAHRYAAVPFLLSFLGGPWLRVFWLQALRAPGALHEHARAASRCYRSALAIGAGTALATLLALGGALGTFMLVQWLAAFVFDDRWQTLLALLLAAPMFVAGPIYLALLCDIAQLQLLESEGAHTFRAAIRAAIPRIDRRLLAARAVLACALLVSGALALSARAWLDSGAAVLLVGQPLLLAQTGLRAVWFCQLLRMLESGSPAPRADGSTTPTR